MSSFFSIILPTYNRANLLPKAIESLINQDYKDWELIVVDDGSSDNTKEVVEAFDDPRIQYVYQENAERSAARNNGIRLAKGRYIGFLDSDDQFHEKHLEGLCRVIDEHEGKEFIYVIKGLTINEALKTEAKIQLKEGKSDLETVLLNSITPGQFVVPASIMKECLFDKDIRISEDTEVLVRLVQKGKLKIINQFTLHYYQHEDNSVNTDKYNVFWDRKNTLEYIFARLPKAKLSGSFKNRLLSNCYFGIYRFHKAQGNKFQAKWNIFLAIFKYPRLRLKEKIYLLLKG
tara:strand:- start:25 stop:891 length:867 start_codon:yes stop_codon:yes gene_type:complete